AAETPALVVAMAGKPSASNTRALAASQALGRTRIGGVWWRARSRSAGSGMAPSITAHGSGSSKYEVRSLSAHFVLRLQTSDFRLPTSDFPPSPALTSQPPASSRSVTELNGACARD